MNLETLIPLRNPTAVFDQTVESLALQTDEHSGVERDGLLGHGVPEDLDFVKSTDFFRKHIN